MEGSSGTGSSSCEICGRAYKTKGIARHRKACQTEKAERDAREKYLREKKERDGSSSSKANSKAAKLKQILPWEIPHSVRSNKGELGSVQDVVCTTASSVPTEQSPASSGSAINVQPGRSPKIPIDSIKTEYHPHSGRAHRMENSEDYKERDTTNIPLPSTEPWCPFQSKLDFEFAEVVLESCLSKKQVEKLISIVQRCQTGEEHLNIGSHKQLCETWDRASSLLTPFEKCTISPLYKGLNRQYDFWYRPLWDWAMDLVSDLSLAPFFEWDAQRLYKFDGNDYIHEPWTADRFWEVQSALPHEGKPLGFILFADKTRLSSFGTEKGYPVFARLANLATPIRNSQGYRGGRLCELAVHHWDYNG